MIPYIPDTLLKDAKALAPFVLLALILHAALLFMIPQTHREPSVRNTALEVSMQHQVTLKPLSSPHFSIDNSEEVSPGSKVPEPREKLPDRPESLNSVRVPINPSEPSQTAGLQNPLKAAETGEEGGNVTPARMNATQALLNSAYQIAREAGKGHQEAKGPSPALSDRPVLPELARLLAINNAIPRVTEYADGVIKVVTESGTSYCMQAGSNLPQDGPVKPGSIPMTCP